jgi:L-fuculose-phosphate aldolase
MNKIVSETMLRKQICDIGNKMYEKNFVAANDGNISARLGDKYLIVTPTGISKGGMKPEQLVKMDLDGNVYGNNKPSSEVKMHLEVYKQNPSLKAVCHAHPPISTAFSVAGIQLDRPILAEAVVNLGIVPVANYATPGTQEVPNSIKDYVNKHNAVLLANHGLLTWGDTLEQAWFRMESTEHYGRILLYVKQIGPANEFNCDQLGELINIREKIGIKAGGVPTCKVEPTPQQEEDVEEMIKTITKKVLESLR